MAGDEEDDKNSKINAKRAHSDNLSGSADGAEFSKSASAALGKGKKPRISSYDEARRKEIRETNRLAARECRARKKRLMSELEVTLNNLTAEHNALLRQNRELTIRLETLQLCHSVITSAPAGDAPAGNANVATSIANAILGVQRSAGIPPIGQSNLLLGGGGGGAQLGLLAGLQAHPSLKQQVSKTNF